MSQIITDTKRTLYASAFLVHFGAKFSEAELNARNSFELDVDEFDEFLAVRGFGSYNAVPEPGTADWSKFRGESNTVRSELNSASKFGAHGEPPFEVVWVRGNLEVRLLTEMVRVTHKEMAEQILSLVQSKSADFRKRHDFLVEHKEEFPPALQGLIGMQEKSFNRHIATIRTVIDGYIEDTSDVYEQAAIFITEAKQLEVSSE